MHIIFWTAYHPDGSTNETATRYEDYYSAILAYAQIAGGHREAPIDLPPGTWLHIEAFADNYLQYDTWHTIGDTIEQTTPAQIARTATERLDAELAHLATD